MLRWITFVNVQLSEIQIS